MNTFFFFNALERWGIDPKSVTILSIPGTQPRLAAIVAGAIDATVLAPPFSFEAEKYNLTQLANFATGTDPFPQSGLVVRKELLRGNRDLVKRMLRAEEKAMALPAKLMVPLILFIFPCLMGVLMLPAGYRIATTLIGAGAGG